MTGLRSTVGAVVGLAVLLALVAGARTLRRRHLAGLSGPPAWLTDVVVVVSTVVVVAQLLGVVGLFRVEVLGPVLVLCGVGEVLVGRRGGAPDSEDADEPAVPSHTTPVVTGVAVLAVGVLVAGWVPRLLHVYRSGPLTIDTLWYHLPIAASFVQRASTLGLTFVSGADSLPTYYPHTSELLHATGIVFLGHDTLTPVVNLLWLGVALLAAWCIGRPFGVAPLALASAALVLSGPQLVMYEAGQGINDLFGVAFVLAALAVVVNVWNLRSPTVGMVVAGLAMGLALGSKLTLIGPAAALTVCVVAFAPRGRRWSGGGAWLVGLALTGSFWYLRNLVEVGNPLPPLELFGLPHVDAVGDSSVWSHLFSSDTWSRDFLPGFRYAMGPAWWAVALIALAGLVFGLVTKVDGRLRLVAIVGMVSFVVYLFTPQTMGLFGTAGFFKYNVRYLVVPFVIGAAAFAIVCSRWSRHASTAVASMFGTAIVANQLDRHLWPFDNSAPPELGLPPLTTTELAVGVVAGVVVVVLAVIAIAAWRAGRRPPSTRSALVVGVTIGALVAVGGVLVIDRLYVDRRYAHSPFFTRTYQWARGVKDARIGLTGTFLQYPLTGNTVSNRVRFLDDRTSDLGSTPIVDCPTWRGVVDRHRLDYVVVATPYYPAGSVHLAPEQKWTETDPAAHLVLVDRTGSAESRLYRLSGPLDPSTCPPARGATPAR